MMTKMVNRRIIFVFALLMAFSLVLSGCGSAKTNDQTSRSDVDKTIAKATETSQEKKLEPYEIKVVYACGAVPVDLQLVEDEMNKYLAEKINATVSLMPIDWGGWSDKTKLMFASGEKIDYIISSNSLNYAENVAKGAYLQLDDLLKNAGQEIVNVVGMDKIKGTAVGGKIFGVPVWKEIGSDYGFFFKKDLIDKYKFDISSVKKPEDLEPMLKTIKENEPGITPLYMNGSGQSRTAAGSLGMGLFDRLGTMNYFGVIPYDSTDLQVKNAYEIPEFVNILKWTHKMFKAGYINKSAMTEQNEGDMKAGKAFCMPFELIPGADKVYGAAWGITVVQKEITGPHAECDAPKGIMGSIGKTSKDPDRTMMFMNMLYTDAKLLNMFIFGIENKHYVKKNDTTIDYPAGVDPQKMTYSNASWMFGNRFLNYLWASQDPDQWNQYKKFNDSVKKSPALGFGFNGESLKTELAALENTYSKYAPALYTGSVDPDTTLPKMISELKAAGLDKIIAEKQKQLNEWAKTK